MDSEVRAKEQRDEMRSPQVCPKKLEEAAMTPFLKRLTFFSSSGSFLDGYVLAIIGVALVDINSEFNLSVGWLSAISASVFAGMFIGAIAGGYLADVLGRKKMFIIDIVGIGVFSFLSIFVADPVQLIIARFLVGVFIGADYPIATSLITEFVPRSSRATAMGFVMSGWYLGATSAALVGFALYGLDNSWQWMLATAVIPCAIILIGRHDIPETPYWLEKNGKHEESRMVINKYYGGEYELSSSEKPAKTSITLIFQKGYLGRVVFISLLIVCQIIPMYAIYLFGPDILVSFGLNAGKEALLGEVVISSFFLLGCLPAIKALNKIGRRKALLVSLFFMAAGMFTLAAFPKGSMIVIVGSFIVYAFFNGAPSILQWLYPNEIFPTQIRSTAVGFAVAASRIGSIIGVFVTPLALASFGIVTTMFIAGCLSVFALILAFFLAPETKGKTLEETSSL